MKNSDHNEAYLHIENLREQHRFRKFGNTYIFIGMDFVRSHERSREHCLINIVQFRVRISYPQIAIRGSTLFFRGSLLSNFLWNSRIKTSLLLEFSSSRKPRCFCLHCKSTIRLLQNVTLYTIFLHLDSILATNPQRGAYSTPSYSLAVGTLYFCGSLLKR